MKKRVAAALVCAMCLLPMQALGEGIRLAASCVPAMLAGLSAGAEHVSLFIMPQAGYMEDYELAQTDYLRAQSADAVLLIGGGLESFDTMLYAQGLKPAIAAGEDIARMPGRVLDPDEDSTPAENPYVWLSPARWGQLVHGVSAALAQLDPAREAHYAQANDAAQEAVARVEQAMEAQLRAYTGRRVIVMHPALAYLCADAGLDVVMEIERDPSVIPYPADIEDISAMIAAYPDAVLVLEKGADKAFEGIGGRKTAVCDVLLRAPERLHADLWENTMLSNIEALAKALE